MNNPTPPIPDNGLEERIDEFLTKASPEHHIWWCDTDNTRWNMTNNLDFVEQLEQFFQQELHTAIEEERKRFVEEIEPAFIAEFKHQLTSSDTYDILNFLKGFISRGNK